jgi:hypothetical protein
MSLPFFFMMNTILISRLVFTFKDSRITKKQVIVMILMQVLCLAAYRLSSISVGLGVMLAIINVVFYLLEKKLEKINRLRLLSLVVFILTLSFFFSPRANLQFYDGMPNFFQSLGDYFLPFASFTGIDWLEANLIFFGLLLVINEANILIRYLFLMFNLAPTKKVETDKRIIRQIDKREYNAGRIIGILERVLIYYFVLNAQYAAIGLILAAKSFTRFRELEKREFAEYVLIGTLVSTLLAMLAAGLTQFLISNIPSI